MLLLVKLEAPIKMKKMTSREIDEIVSKHLDKVNKISRNVELLLNRLNLRDYFEVKLIPLIITWHRTHILIHKGVPIVSIFQLNDFLMNLDNVLDTIFTINVKVKPITSY